MVVWDPRVSVFVYKATSQSVTCGILLLAENISFTVTFCYAFNLLEDRTTLWEELVLHNETTPVTTHPRICLGDFN